MKKAKKKSSSKNQVDRRTKKSSPTKEKPTVKGKFGAAFEKWKDGAPMSQLAKELGARRRELKKAFVKLAGSKDKFTALRDAGAGGKAFGGKRSGGGRTKAVIALDDSKVPVLESKNIPFQIHSAVLTQAKELKEALEETLEKDHKLNDSERKRMYTGFRNARRIVKHSEQLKKHKGWKCEHYQSRYGTAIRLLAPDGKRYVRAAPTERADYIVVSAGMQRTRFKHEKEARVAKVDAQDSKLVEHGNKILKHRKKVRKQKRNAKKSKAA